ncbi:MAG: carbonic anhydrase [Caulobacterales bacterium 32-69-10]|nr:MAG: carbonic anhydrase [Caulobacterales bacterium 32-69-10]
MPKFAAGVVKFQQEVFPQQAALFEKLAHGQTPEALFITCSDSRIETGMLTQSLPGDLFVVRNAGNIVPPHFHGAGATTSAIEFACVALNVPHIVVCGHTQCGAMKGAMNLDGLDTLPHVRDWLSYSKAAVDITNELGKDLNDHDRNLMLLEQNVILQLQHLRTHPAVAVRLARGDLRLHGWVYDIADGEVYAYNEETGGFEPVSKRYAAEVAKHLALHTHDGHTIAAE